MPRRRRQPTRNTTDQKYVNWRNAVFARDKGKCRFPRCTKKGPKQVHHIERWADNPGLRFNVDNGITLCRKCHAKVTGHESMYRRLFKTIVHNQTGYDVRKIIRDATQEDEETET